MRNHLRTFMLLAALTALFVGAGYMVGGPTGMGIAFLLALVMNAVSYWNSDKIAIKAMQAYPVSAADQPAMHRIVSELSSKAGQPMPALFVSPTTAPNAFATGRNPSHAAVCCTEGILHLLDERELRGVGLWIDSSMLSADETVAEILRRGEAARLPAP